MGRGDLPSIRDDVSFGYGLGYPLLLAPIWALSSDVQTAYAVAKGVNALVMSLTAVPAFFLARRFATDGYALLVAALSVGIPSLLYSGVLLTEVALYPAFTLALLAVVAALERPVLSTQGGALGAIALACTIKMLASVALVAYIASIVVYHYLETRSSPAWIERLKAYAPTWFALIALALACVAAAIASGRTPLGAYGVVVDNVDLSATPRWAVRHIAELDLYLAVVPFAATAIVVWRGLKRDGERREHLFAALTTPLVVTLVIVVAAFASTASPGGVDYPENVSRLHERSTFLLAPLFFVGFALWLRDRRGTAALTAAAVLIAMVLPALIPLGEFDSNVRFQALALVPWVEQSDRVHWPWGVLAVTSLIGFLFMFSRHVRAPAWAFVVPVALVFAVVTASAHHSMQWASAWTRSAAWGTSPTWIDDAVGERDSVSVLWAESPGRRFANLEPRHRIVFVGEFFNRKVGTVFELGSPLPYGLPTVPVALVAGHAQLLSGQPAALGDLVLVPCYVHVRGTSVARDVHTGASVIRVSRPLNVSIDPPDSCPEPGEPG